MGLCHSNENHQLNHPKHPALEEKVDSWFDEILHGAKHIGENFLELVGKKIKHSVTDAERVVLKATKGLEIHHLAETCIPGVYSHNGLHDDVEQLFNTEIFNELGILKTTLGMQPFFEGFQGKDRSTANYEKIWNYTSEKLGFDASDFPFDHFPKSLDAKQLKTLISTNPFVTMGLSTAEEGHKDWVVFDATKNSSNPLTAMICACLPDDYATAKVWISADFKELHVEEGGVKYSPDHPKFDVKLRIFVTTLMYFFEMIHAVLHVYAYIMLGAASQATSGTAVDSFMGQYEEKILTKYFEVTKLLITKGNDGLVVGGYWPADHRKAMDATTEIFKHLAQAKDAQQWLDLIFLAGNPDLKHNLNLLPQCRPYVGLTKSLAHQTLRNISIDDREQVDVNLRNYLRRTAGENSQNGYFTLSTFQDWIECQTMMGILHGNTLTISRLIFTPYNRYDGNWESEVFSKTAHTWAVVAGTLLGLEEDHAINEAKPVEDTLFENMMTHFQVSTKELQQKFWNTLELDDKRMLGWIYSVWGPNMLGNTQLTVTTYV